MKNYKKIISMILAVVMILGLAACGKKDPAPTEPIKPTVDPTENIEPTPSENPPEYTVDPDTTPEPEVTVEPSEKPTTEVGKPYSNELTVTLFPDCEAEMTFPESWRDKYFVSTAEENHFAVSTYEDQSDPSTEIQLAEFVKKPTVEEDDIPEKWATVLVERDDFCIVMYTNNDLADKPELAQMVADLDTDSFFYIPEVKVIPEDAQPLVDAIVNARSDEENEYNEVIADPEDEMVYGVLGLDRENVKNFAASVSMMNVRAYAVAIVEAIEDKVDDVVTVLENYKTTQIESYENYLPDQLEIAKNTIVEKIGNYAVIVMCDQADTVFNSIKTVLEQMA